ncbi:hypothetical protein Tco_1247706 [Tanacetum coccineum]
MIGTLLYLTASRPDLQFAICMCARILPFALLYLHDADHAVVKIHAVVTSGSITTFGVIRIVTGRLKAEKRCISIRKLNILLCRCLCSSPLERSQLYDNGLTLALSKADQIALDDALVAPADLPPPNPLRLEKCKSRLSSEFTSKEATLQVVYDVHKLTPFTSHSKHCRSPEIYMQEFLGQSSKFAPKVGNEEFVDPPLEKEILIFLASLGHSGDIRKITDVNVNKLHQPWRSFAASNQQCPRITIIRQSPSSQLNLVCYWHNQQKGDIRNTESNKRSYARAFRTIPPKTKGSKKKANTDIITQQKPPTAPKEKKSGKENKRLQSWRISLRQI